MKTQAVILIPSGGEQSSSYLFNQVAGVPFLPRQILGLQRAGITEITILAPPELGEFLIRKLTGQCRLGAGIKIFSRWPDIWVSDATKDGPGSSLAMLVNSLPNPSILKVFVDSPPPPGGITLGVVRRSPQDLMSGAKVATTTPDPQPMVHLNNGMVVSLGLSGTENGLHFAGLALFSEEAWNDWHVCQKPEEVESLVSAAAVTGNLYDYFARKASENQVLGTVMEPSDILFICDVQDQAAATERLIASQNYSPVGEGILENSWNRRIAHRILPWILNRDITPNQITFAAFLVGLLAVWGFSLGSYGASVAAALTLPLILMLDCLDGAVARLKFQETRLGALLDLHGDTILNLLLLLGIALGSFRASGQSLFLVAGFVLAIGYLHCWWLINFARAHPILADKAMDSPVRGHDKILQEVVSRDFFYIILLLAILNWLDWMIVAIAVGTNVFALIFRRCKLNGQH